MASTGEGGWGSLDGRTYKFHPWPGSGARRSIVLATGSPQTCSPRLPHDLWPVLGGESHTVRGPPTLPVPSSVQLWGP